MNSDILRQAVSRAWDGQYIGRHHNLLLNNINSLPRYGPYSQSVILLQSSGTGKSRMVHEQSDLVFTLPFNLYYLSENKDIAYPPPDVAICRYLDESASNFLEYEARYLHLLGHLFRTVANELDGPNMMSQPTYAMLAKAWRKHMDDSKTRARIYETAVNGCSYDNLSQLRHSYPWEGADLSSSLQYAAREWAKDELARLLKGIDKSCKSMDDVQDYHVKLMLYFDEVDILAEQRVLLDPYGRNVYDALCSCFNYFLPSPIFVIYLSKNPNISLLVPNNEPLSRSARVRSSTDALEAPITETPFDCSPEFPIQPGKLGLKDICRVEFMAQFGRPLFWALIAGAEDGKAKLLSQIIDLVRSKLICQKEILVKHTELPPAAVTAVLDVLLNLDFRPRYKPAEDREAELVASHMRIAFLVPKHRKYCHSGYPSEPILAEAAASQMDDFQMLSAKPDSSVMANILMFQFWSGLLDQGQQGEIVFRQLVSEAYRRAVREDYLHEYPFTFSKGCKLITFMEQLFSKDYACQILDSVPDNVKTPTTFREAFKDSIVRFTHFAKMTDDTGTTTHAMFAAFVRCMAIICRSSQNVVDLLIPVLLRRGDMLQESAMTGLLIQIKRKGSLRRCEIDQKVLGFFPSSADKRPYIAIVAEFGLQLPFSPAVITEKNVREKLATPPLNLTMPGSATQRKLNVVKTTTRSATSSELHIPSQPDRILHPRDVHPRYSIYAYGCSDTVYGVISHSDRSIYELKSHDEHPRTDENSLHAVQELKPLWRAGSGSYGWIDEPVLRKYQDECDEDRLVIGQYEDDTIGETEENVDVK